MSTSTKSFNGVSNDHSGDQQTGGLTGEGCNANSGDVDSRSDASDWKLQQNRRQRRKHLNPESSGHRKITTNDRPGWMKKLPYLIPQSTETTQQQHILLLAGLPGSGKTTLATILCQLLPWKYRHVNQDILQNRPACLRETQRILNEGKCPIIDRCNMSRQQRRYFTQFTLTSSSSSSVINSTPSSSEKPTYIPVDCVVLQIASVAECIQRCQQRTDHPTLPPDQVRRVIAMMQKEWLEPQATTTTTKRKTPPNVEQLRSVITLKNGSDLQQFIAAIGGTTTTSLTEEDMSTSTKEGILAAVAENDTTTSPSSLVSVVQGGDMVISQDEEITMILDNVTLDEDKGI